MCKDRKKITEAEILSVKEHQENINQLKINSKAVFTLKEMYRLNKKNINKKNDNLIKLVANEDLLLIAYEKIRKNKGAFTEGTEKETPEGMNLQEIKRISESILKEEYIWKPIRRKLIPKPGKKKMRPLGVVNFQDKMVQEVIRMILTCIYEPLFQETESNHGFRPSRSTETCLIKIQRESKEMDWALEGDIKGAYDNVNHKKMIEILKKKINDKKFLKLIKNGLEQNILLEDKKIIKNLVGTPQGGIASPILFNIYMHEFDLKVLEIIDGIGKEINEKELRTEAGRYSREYKRFNRRKERANEKLQKNMSSLNKHERIELIEKIRKSKKEQLRTVGKLKDSLKIRFTYNRYADDWIIITNGKRKIIENIKEMISEILRKELNLELDQDKTLVTNLHTQKSKFLGFTLFAIKKRIIRKKTKNNNIYRQRSTVPLTIGIDGDRVMNRLKNIKFVTTKGKPRAVGTLSTLQTWRIIEHYRQRTEGLLNYYFNIITFKNEINRYHYLLRFSLLHTLAKRQKSSLKKITLKYGYELKAKYIEKTKTAEDVKEVERTVTFPSLKEFKKKLEEQKQHNDIIRYSHMKRNKGEKFNYLPTIDFDQISKFENFPKDPFSKNLFSINLRSKYQLTKYCVICGKSPGKTQTLEIHHLKHVRKGKLEGFNAILQQINRKQIPVCSPCHKKIHQGKYDGYDLGMLFDQNIVIS